MLLAYHALTNQVQSPMAQYTSSRTNTATKLKGKARILILKHCHNYNMEKIARRTWMETNTAVLILRRAIFIHCTSVAVLYLVLKVQVWHSFSKLEPCQFSATKQSASVRTVQVLPLGPQAQGMRVFIVLYYYCFFKNKNYYQL